MSARDVYHDQCKAALVKDGWRITHDPLSVKWGKKDLRIDLGAEELLAAEKLGRQIAMEIKSFVGPSEMYDLEQALGQFILYRTALKAAKQDRELYLAITVKTYRKLFATPEGRLLIEEVKLRIVVFDPKTQEVKRWIP
jgi:hypothetical protein